MQEDEADDCAVTCMPKSEENSEQSVLAMKPSVSTTACRGIRPIISTRLQVNGNEKQRRVLLLFLLLFLYFFLFPKELKLDKYDITYITYKSKKKAHETKIDHWKAQSVRKLNLNAVSQQHLR